MKLKIIAIFPLLSMLISSVGQQSPFPPVVHLTSGQDHQRIMDLLGMKTIRHAREGNSASPFYANCDESKASPSLQIPDPLLLANGKRVGTTATWWSTRRPQIVRAKLNRRNWGEVVENVAATNEYHWLAGNFLKYAGPLQWSDLRVDSHELIALVAPRPLFIGRRSHEWRRLG